MKIPLVISLFDPQNTAGVTYTYDRRGRQKTVAHHSMTTTLSYNDASQMLSESHSGGGLNGLAVTNAYDAYLRRTAVGLNTQPSTLTRFGYDNARVAGRRDQRQLPRGVQLP